MERPRAWFVFFAGVVVAGCSFPRQAGTGASPGTAGSGLGSPLGSAGNSGAGGTIGPGTCGGTALGGSCPSACGDGLLDTAAGEVCDDGNFKSGDGCSGSCRAVEKDYACPTAGKPCTYLVKCGDGMSVASSSATHRTWATAARSTVASRWDTCATRRPRRLTRATARPATKRSVATASRRGRRLATITTASTVTAVRPVARSSPTAARGRAPAPAETASS